MSRASCMRMIVILIVLTMSISATGCIATQVRGGLDEARDWWSENADQITEDAKRAAESYVEGQLAKKDRQNYQEALIFAEDNGIAETKVDPDMDGSWTDEERIAWQKYRTAFVAKDMARIATQGVLRGDDKTKIMEDIRAKYPDLWEAFGGSAALALMSMLGLHRYRNGTRKRALADNRAPSVTITNPSGGSVSGVIASAIEGRTRTRTMNGPELEVDDPPSPS